MSTEDRSARTHQVFDHLMYSVNNPPVGWQYDVPTTSNGRKRALPMTTMTGNQDSRRAARAALQRRQVSYNTARMDEYRRSLQGRENLIHHQGITILTQLSGKQFGNATASNLGSRKAYLTVAIGSVILTIRSKKAALRYAKVWVHFSTYALTMPQWTPGNSRVTRYNEPGVMVAVTDRGSDHRDPRPARHHHYVRPGVLGSAR